MPAERGHRLVIVEHHQLFAEAMELALVAAGYDVRRAAVPESPTHTAGLLGAVARLRPQVVLLDLDLGGFGDGLRLVEPLSRWTAVVVLTSSTDRARWGEALYAGARTVLTTSESLRDALAAVRRVGSGLPAMDAATREELVAEAVRWRLAHDGVRERLGRLTTREAEVLGHLSKGRTVREIAALGVVSEATVRSQVKSVLSKLGVSSQLAAVGLVHGVGWRAPISC